MNIRNLEGIFWRDNEKKKISMEMFKNEMKFKRIESLRGFHEILEQTKCFELKEEPQLLSVYLQSNLSVHFFI